MPSVVENWFDSIIKSQDMLQDVANGSMSASDYYSYINTHPSINLTSDQEKWLDNLLANQRTEEARQWEDYMASNDLLRAAGQLEQIGLSPNNVLQTGGSSANGVGAAQTVKENMAENRYQRQNALARSLIGMASAMGHAGITGGSMALVKSVAGNVASQAAHGAASVARLPYMTETYRRYY